MSCDAAHTQGQALALECKDYPCRYKNAAPLQASVQIPLRDDGEQSLFSGRGCLYVQRRLKDVPARRGVRSSIQAVRLMFSGLP